MRYCRVRISQDCEIIFKSVKGRPKACSKCKDVLKQKGLSIERYLEWKQKDNLKSKEHGSTEIHV